MFDTPEELSHPVFHDEEAARLYLQEVRWPDGVVCPYCGSLDGIKPLGGDSMGPGWFYCESCQDKFTVRVGSIFERSHIPLHKWLLGFRLMASSKKGVSAHQLHRTLKITYKSAWFLAMRIREAMAPTDPPRLGGEGRVVEVDETFIGKRDDFKNDPNPWQFNSEKGWHKKRRGGHAHMNAVVTLVERGGSARSIKADGLNATNLRAVVLANADTKSALMTDEFNSYTRLGRRFATHDVVTHRDEEYVRYEKSKDGKRKVITTNTVEGYFSVFKRGMKGVYQHCSEKHLHRYLSEFDFRYSNRSALGVEDVERTERAIKGAEGKRLTYRRTSSAA